MVERSQRQMIGVALRFARHEPVLKVNLHDLGNLRRVGQDAQSGDKRERLVAFERGRGLQFGDDGQTYDKIIIQFGKRPPFARLRLFAQVFSM